MKALWLGLCLLVFSQWAWLEELPVRTEVDVSAQRRLISESMRQQNERFDNEVRVCSQKFAVTGCVNAVESHRRAAIAELRRQDADLNALERQRRTQDQVKRLEEKARDRARQDAELASVSHQESKTSAEHLAAEQGQLAVSAQVSEPGAKALKPSPAIDAQQVQKNRAQADRKLEALRKRRLDRDKRQKEKKGNAAGIPVPP
jgi:hypothetical protein